MLLGAEFGDFGLYEHEKAETMLECDLCRSGCSVLFFGD
jgi:hypothetical protein